MEIKFLYILNGLSKDSVLDPPLQWRVLAVDLLLD